MIAIYPGSFDPITNGHLDLIRRSAKLADQLIVAVLNNTSKHAMFSLAERRDMISEAAAGIDNVEVDCFDGLLVDYAGRRNAHVIVRGVRTVADYETEQQMASLNRSMRPGTETILLTATAEFSFISSRMIKEVIKLGGDVSQFVPAARSQAAGLIFLR